MITNLSLVTILVRDQEEALKWYVEKLGFEKRDDQTFGQGMRWLTVAPPGQKEVEIVINTPGPTGSPEEVKDKFFLVGKQSQWVFSTNDCRGDVDAFKSRGVQFTRGPEEVPWGTQAIFEDLYGNSWVLLEHRAG